MGKGKIERNATRLSYKKTLKYHAYKGVYAHI